MSKVNIWLNRRSEDEIRKLGFTFPKLPKSGDVILDNQIVGYIDNFTGLTINDHKSEAFKILKSEEDRLKLAIWDGGLDV